VPFFGATSRRDFIKFLRKAGFDGPFVGGRHEFVVRDKYQVRLPNPHTGDISKDLMVRLLKEAGITREEWERL
jgi:hypothetical protein